jgi:hypothetical protein
MYLRADGSPAGDQHLDCNTYSIHNTDSISTTTTYKHTLAQQHTSANCNIATISHADDYLDAFDHTFTNNNTTAKCNLLANEYTCAIQYAHTESNPGLGRNCNCQFSNSISNTSNSISDPYHLRGWWLLIFLRKKKPKEPL